jgi:hypothetical protein
VKAFILGVVVCVVLAVGAWQATLQYNVPAQNAFTTTSARVSANTH